MFIHHLLIENNMFIMDFIQSVSDEIGIYLIHFLFTGCSTTSISGTIQPCFAELCGANKFDIIHGTTSAIPIPQLCSTNSNLLNLSPSTRNIRFNTYFTTWHAPNHCQHHNTGSSARRNPIQQHN
jgi:hypothetical protein